MARPGRRAPYTQTVELDLGTVVPSLAGPRRPQDRVADPTPGTQLRAALADMAPQPQGNAARRPHRPQARESRPGRGLGRVVSGQRPAGINGRGHPGRQP